MIFLSLFFSFFQIGLFGFGGGYGMLSLIQREVVFANHWLTAAEFTDIVAISQMTPGPIGINTATYAGYMALKNIGAEPLFCVLGSLVASVSIVLPSFILMLLISVYFIKFKESAAVQGVFITLRPAVVGLLLAATLMLVSKETFGSFSENALEFFISCGLFLLTFVCTYFFKINPIKMIVVCGILGGVFFS